MKISISIEENMITKLEELTRDGIFRNKSHAMEFALNKLIKERK